MSKKITDEDASDLLGSAKGDKILDIDDKPLYEVLVVDGWLAIGKYQYNTVIFKDLETGKIHKLDANRTGSPYTDWDYTFELDCPEVQRKERVITQVYYE